MDPSQKPFDFEVPSLNVSDDDNSDEIEMFFEDDDATRPDPEDNQIFESDNEEALEIPEDSLNVTPKKDDGTTLVHYVMHFYKLFVHL
ncbi:hypothetical protein L6452_00839 [Arctium lappa]|uniref:Uncharacterized protein n=1 Tax=Arctium lappa TaxID=4217 RepID=A0ACB9FFU5_ARCLA|nr:hypothetical protein L6452_00839 [Arctium lappa]